MIKLSKAIFASVFAITGMVAANAQAQTATSTFNVTASVSANCTISTVGINFGAYDPVVANAATPVAANGSVTVACTAGAVTEIGFDQGSFPDGASSAAAPIRRMDAGVGQLGYDLYQDAALATVWGDVGTPSALAYTAADFNPQTITIYGQIPAGQDAQVGSYTDTVTATVSF